MSFVESLSWKVKSSKAKTWRDSVVFWIFTEKASKKYQKMPELYEATTLNPDHVMEDHSYGKGGVKILCVAKNGEAKF